MIHIYVEVDPSNDTAQVWVDGRIWPQNEIFAEVFDKTPAMYYYVLDKEEDK